MYIIWIVYQMNEMEKESMIKSFRTIIDDALFGLRKIDAITGVEREEIDNTLYKILKDKGY